MEKISEKWSDYYRNNFGIEVGVCFPSSENASYKRHMCSLGSSDSATLALVGYRMGHGVCADIVHFGGDGGYSAWLVDDPALIPAHYSRVMNFKYWVKIFDDNELCLKIDYRKGTGMIGIYRAGEYGLLICVNDNL